MNDDEENGTIPCRIHIMELYSGFDVPKKYQQQQTQNTFYSCAISRIFRVLHEITVNKKYNEIGNQSNRTRRRSAQIAYYTETSTTKKNSSEFLDSN